MSLSTFIPRQSEPSDSEDESENEDTIYRIICLENTDYSLASRGGHVVFALTNYFDRYQHWIKDKRHGATIKDSEGQPAFAVINRASGQAISHCPTSQPVPLVPYNMNSCDESVLWSMSKDAYSGGFRYIHRADLISNNWSAVTYTIHDGRNMTLCAPPVVAYGNQPLTWKFVKVSPSSCITLFIPSQHTVKIICQVNVGYNLAIDKDGRTVLLVPSNPKDKYQHWSKETAYGVHVKDVEGNEAFALVNKATGKAIKHGFGCDYLVQVALFNRNYMDPSLLWTESSDVEGGFRQIRMQSNTQLVFQQIMGNSPLLGLTNLAAYVPDPSQLWKIKDFE